MTLTGQARLERGAILLPLGHTTARYLNAALTAAWSAYSRVHELRTQARRTLAGSAGCHARFCEGVSCSRQAPYPACRPDWLADVP